MNIIVTGVPGTGKTTIAKKLAKHLHLRYISINQIAKKSNTLKKQGKEVEADLKKLEKTLREILRKNKRVVIEGHLGCEMRLPVDIVLVLRCDPRVLQRRLEKRGYRSAKLLDNLLAEAEDYCSLIAKHNYACPVVDVNTTQFPSIRHIARAIARKKGDKVNWNRSLLRFAAKAV